MDAEGRFRPGVEIRSFGAFKISVKHHTAFVDVLEQNHAHGRPSIGGGTGGDRHGGRVGFLLSLGGGKPLVKERKRVLVGGHGKVINGLSVAGERRDRSGGPWLRGGLFLLSRACSIGSRKNMKLTQDTIAALATPLGTAALAVVRVSGIEATRLVWEIFRATPLPRTARHADYHDVEGGLLDDVVYTYFKGPQSYTGEDALEISCHGNPFVAQKIMEDLFVRGCRPADPGEFTKRAFLNNRMDLSQAEAVMDIIHARSERALAVAQQQLRGALGRRMGALVDEVLGVLARIEAYIDFPEEDLPGEDRGRIETALQHVLRGTNQMLATSHYGELLREGIKTIIVGEPNVGKSSLLNRLVGQERAIVSSEPGTTRDFIEERLLVGAHCLRLIDTAGLNRAPQPLERLGMAKTLERAAEADLFLIVLELPHPALTLPEEVRLRLNASNTVVVINKTDLVAAADGDFALPEGLAHLPGVRISALTGAGVEALRGRIGQMAESLQQQAGGEEVAINARHAHALECAKAGLAAAIQQLRNQGAMELLASDLRGVLTALGEISGRIDNERMLDRLFATFCIGK